jgi:hypothetical protein
MAKGLSSVVAELRQNSRLRAGLWLIIAILLGYSVVLLDDYQSQLKKAYQDSLTRLNQLRGIVQETQWVERALQAKELREQLEVKFWQANSPGLAQAQFQKWLNSQMERARLEKAYLRMESTLEMPKFPQVWRVTARIDANFEADKLNILLLAIADYPLFIVTDKLEIRNITRFTYIVTAYFKISTSN